MTLLDSTEKLRRDRVLIEALIEDPSGLGPDFQPIKRLSDNTLVGYKATGRGQAGTDMDSTLALMSGAQSTGLLERLDWSFRCMAFDVATAAGLNVEILLTPEPETFLGFCPPRLATAFGRGRRALKVAAEVHDEAFAHPKLEAAVAEWRGWGWRVVVSDVASLLGTDRKLIEKLNAIRPNAITVDLSKPNRESDPHVAEILAWAHESGVEIHGVELDTEGRREQAVALGVTVARGRLIGPPARMN